MSKYLLAAAILTIGLSGCGNSQDTSATEPVAETGGDEINAFALAIDSERWGVMIGNAQNLLADGAGSGDPDDAWRANQALKDGARDLMRLRDDVCSEGLVTAEVCSGLEFPAWVYRYEPEVPSLEVLQSRSDWLGGALQPFEAAVCSDGAGGHSMECMVE